MGNNSSRGCQSGTFLLFVSFVLLLASSVSSPVTRQISLLRVQTQNSQPISFGVLGYCSNGDTTIRTQLSGDGCSIRSVGYNISSVVSNITGRQLPNRIGSAADNATKGLILHPIATGVLFFAFVIALLSSRLGYLLASFVAFIGFALALVAMALDFSIFIPIRNFINNSGSGAVANLEAGVWLTLAGTIIAFIASIATCCACVSDRRSRNNGSFRR